MGAQVIQFDYDFSPYGQKTRLVLKAAGVDFQRCEQPAVLPRKDLEALDITYRRIPLLAVGKDLYLDSNRIIDQILSSLGKALTSPADSAYQTWGDAVFSEVLSVIPTQVLSPDFVKDRESVFPILARPDFKSLRPSGLASFHQRLEQLEKVFLSNSSGPFINGEKLSVADIHVIWSVRWALNDLGAAKEPGFGKDAYPKVWKLIESLPQIKPEDLSAEEAQKTILGSEYAAKGPTTVEKDDPLGIAAGTPVSIESADTTAGAYPQTGKLVGTTADEVVIELGNGVRLHFPRIGYIVRAQ